MENKNKITRKNWDKCYEGIKNIKLVLEDCTLITISREDIGELIIKDFEDIFWRRAINNISLQKNAKYFILQIRDSSRKHIENTTLGQFDDSKEYVLIDRLKEYPDITHVIVNYEWDDEKYSWCLDWGGNSEIINDYQSTEEMYGDIWIAVGKKAQKELYKYFPTCQEDRDFKWDMWDISTKEGAVKKT